MGISDIAMKNAIAISFAFAIAFAIQATAFAQPPAADLLDKARETMMKRNYTCVVRIFKPRERRGPAELYHRILHSEDGSVRIQPLIVEPDGRLSETMVYFIRNRQGRFLIDSERRMVVANPRTLSDIQEILDRTPFGAGIKITGAKVVASRIGSRDAWQVSLKTSATYRLWVDQGNGFPLKFELAEDSGVILLFEVRDLKFIPQADVNKSLFDVPTGYDRPAWREQMSTPQSSKGFEWLPLVPDESAIPAGMHFTTIVPYGLKGKLVFQAIFVSEDGDVISVFQSQRYGLADHIKERARSERMNLYVDEREGVMLIALGNYDEEFLQTITELFYRDDALARLIISEPPASQQHKH